MEEQLSEDGGVFGGDGEGWSADEYDAEREGVQLESDRCVRRGLITIR